MTSEINDILNSEDVIKIYNKPEIYSLKIPQRTDKWFEARKCFLTASEIPEIMISFINMKPFMRRNGVDFAEYKLGRKEREFNEFQISLMERGKLNEHIALSEIYNMVDENNSDSKNLKIEVWPEAVIIRDGWALASTDCILHTGSGRDLKLIAPVEIKYTEFRSTFNKYLEKDHYNFYQLAFQMYVTNTITGYMTVTLNEKDSDMEILTVMIDTDSPYYIEIVKAMDRLKEIHKTICIDKENPYLDGYNNAMASACFVAQLTDKSKKITSYVSKLYKNVNKSRELFDKYEEIIKQFKKKLVNQMYESRSMTCKIDEYNTQVILCDKGIDKYIMIKAINAL